MTSDTARTLRVAALPMDPRRGDHGANLDAALAGLEEAAARGVALLALPELWPSSFPEPTDRPGALLARVERDGRAVEALGARARELGLAVCGSALAEGAGGRPTNRFHLVGAVADAFAYDKVHLFTPTAEHLTFAPGERAPRVVDGPAAGDGGAVRVAPAICYDLRFGALLAPLARDGVELLLVPAQWPRTRAAHWRALVLGRAVELQCCVLAANRSGRESVGRRGLELEFAGNALVATPDGEVAAEGDGTALVAADLDLGRVAALRREVPVLRDARAVEA